MATVTCPHCGAQLDASAFQPGQRIACGGCGQRILLAPPAPVAPVLRPAPPPPPPPPPPAPVPAKDRAAAAERARKSKPSRRPRAPGDRNPMPIVLGGASLLLLGGAGVWLATRPGGPAPAGGGPSGPGTVTAVSAKSPLAPPANPLERAAREAGLDVGAYVEQRVKGAGTTTRAAREAYEFLKEHGREADARRALETAKTSFPYDDWVNARLGLKNRADDIEEAASDIAMQDLLADYPAFREVLEFQARKRGTPGGGWLEEKESSRFDGLLEECRKRVKWLQDPANERTARLLQNLRVNPHFAALRFEARSDRPFVIFHETAPGSAALAAAEKRGPMMEASYRAFHRFLAQDLGLAAPRLEDADDARLRCFVFATRRSFDQWHLDTGQDVPSRGMLAYFTPVHSMMVMHAELGGDAGGGRALETSVTFHEVIHQCFDWYQRYFAEKDGKSIPEGYALLNPARATPDTLFWFQEGLADYFGAADPAPGGGWTVGNVDRGHVETLQWARSQNQVWKVGEFLFADQAEIYDRAEAKNWGRRGADNLKALMYAHGWAAVHFFLHGENGKWRPRFLEYVRREVQGKHIRKDLDALLSDLPEARAFFDKNPQFKAALLQRRDIAIAIQGVIQNSPEIAQLLRVRDLLDAFGLPRNQRDPKVVAWVKELDEGFARYEKTLLKAR